MEKTDQYKRNIIITQSGIKLTISEIRLLMTTIIFVDS